MSHDTFDIFELRPYIERQVTVFCDPICVKMRVDVTIWTLSTNIEYRTIAALFKLDRPTVCELVADTSDAITNHLKKCSCAQE